jgi:hypothetical protein
MAAATPSLCRGRRRLRPGLVRLLGAATLGPPAGSGGRRHGQAGEVADGVAEAAVVDEAAVPQRPAGEGVHAAEDKPWF